jgi:hypothetical protein
MKNQAVIERPSEAGSMFIWLFLMIALFAAVSYTLTKGSRTGAHTVSAEKARLMATEILDYTAKMRDTVKMLQVNECVLENISFYSAQWATPADYDNANSLFADGDFSCHVFHKDGGALTFQSPPAGSTTYPYYITSNTMIWNVGNNGYNDIIVVVPYINEETCRQINKILGVNSFAQDSYNLGQPYKGTIAAGEIVGDDNVNPEYVAGRPAACLAAKDNGTSQTEPSYFFYQVLVSR